VSERTGPASLGRRIRSQLHVAKFACGKGKAWHRRAYTGVANMLSFGWRKCRRFCDSEMSVPGG
jgi:hypothetical protein